MNKLLVRSLPLYAEVWKILAKPFFFLLFFYFFSLSAESINLRISIFKFKLNSLVGPFSLLVFLLSFRMMRLSKEYLAIALGCFSVMCLSALFGHHKIACAGFLCFFIFNYFVFFSFPCNLFRTFKCDLILKLYFWSFVFVGCYATAQVFASVLGVHLPFTGQSIGRLGRGQGFCYEPSYYALYMTPFVIFQTAKFFLLPKQERNLKSMLGANFLFLISTSTGCFFCYLALLLCFGILKIFRLVRTLSIGRLLSRFLLSGVTVIFFLWNINPQVVSSGFLKFFWAGIFNHHSFKQRWEGIAQYWEIFMENPFLGTGLGGASAYYLQKIGIDVSSLDPEILTLYGPTNVTMEVLASLGLLGGLMFGAFFFVLRKTCRITLSLPLNSSERITVLSFIISLCVTFFMMQFNQSIMRAYTWVHVGICVGYMQYLQSQYCNGCSKISEG